MIASYPQDPAQHLFQQHQRVQQRHSIKSTRNPWKSWPSSKTHKSAEVLILSGASPGWYRSMAEKEKKQHWQKVSGDVRRCHFLEEWTQLLPLEGWRGASPTLKRNFKEPWANRERQRGLVGRKAVVQGIYHLHYPFIQSESQWTQNKMWVPCALLKK